MCVCCHPEVTQSQHTVYTWATFESMNISELHFTQWWNVTKYIYSRTVLKGLTSRILRLLFVNAIFEVGPSSTAQSFWWSHSAYHLVPGRSHPARCYWLGATHHWKKGDAQKRPEHSKIRKDRQRPESLQIHSQKYLTLHICSQAVKGIYVYRFL